MSWGSGFRVYLSIEHSKEYRELQIKAGDIVISTKTQYRTVDIESAEYRGLDAASAATQTATSGYTITSRNRVDESGQWVVREEKRTDGTWTDV